MAKIRFGGVRWDVQDRHLEDLECIDGIRIRGAVGTPWCGNAVNGIGNIMKDAEDSQGEFVSLSVGVNEGYLGRVRCAGALGSQVTYRIYVARNCWLPSINTAGAQNYDTWSLAQGELRLDWKTSQKHALTFFDGQTYSRRTQDTLDVFSPWRRWAA
jgi:hypothetical protein